MHDIYWAISKMLDGHRVRRTSWVQKDVVLYIEDTELVVKKRGSEKAEPFMLRKCELEADNWELSDTVVVEYLGEGDHVYVVRPAIGSAGQQVYPVVK